MASNYFGIDLGSYDLKIFDAGLDEIRNYKNAIAIRKVQGRKQVTSTGDEAYEMYQRCASDIQIVYPMQGGVVSDFEAMQYLLQTYVWGGKRNLISGAGYLLAAPADITELEKKALFDLIVHSDARTYNVRLIPSSIADAIGMQLPVFSSDGLFTVNIGGGTTEYSIVASGGLLISKMDKFGGKDFDNAIINYIRREYGFLIGIFAAEELKNNLGYAFAAEDKYRLTPGRSLVSGLPGEIQVSAHEVYQAIRPGLDRIINGCRLMLERIPPEIRDNIMEDGLYLTGGTAQLKNIDRLFERELKLPVHLAQEPDFTTIMGLRSILSDPQYDELTYSMLDKRHRWMR